MAVATRPTTNAAIANPPKRGPSRVLPALVVVQGAAFLFLMGTRGSFGWWLVRELVVVGVTAGAFVLARGSGRVARGATALVLGLAGTVAGTGIGLVYAAKSGPVPPTVAGLVALVTGLWLLGWGFALLTGALRRWWKLLAVPGGLVVLAYVLMPLSLAVNATNRPATPLGSLTPAERGLSSVDASFVTDDRVRLSGWYVPSTNGAAIVLLAGAGSNRTAVLDHAVVLARHGYGVLLLDTRGHGGSEGMPMDFGWNGERDVAAAVGWLEGQPDVRHGRIGAVGMSMGGEQVVAAIGSDPRIRAVVGEGVTGMQAADHGWLSHYGLQGAVQRSIDRVTYGAAGLLSGAARPMPLRDAVRAAAPRPVLIVAAGTVPDEGIAARWLRAASPSNVCVWVVPGAGHTDGLATNPAQWEARVTGFLDRALVG
ncbi:MAG TPA: CocE/NonD family hydrolase [Actinomycetota bacterium]|nr:CocE/NonD family hydrolase [Actinomycetota bacterium]